MSLRETSSPQAFPQTRWSLVVSSSEGALNELCQIYWKPVYGFLRRSGYSSGDAEDLTQSFFIRLLKNNGLSSVDRNKGKMRSYLLGGLKRHLADHLRHQKAIKRGGNSEHLPLAVSELDFEDAEHFYAELPGEEATPDRLFDQSWALDLLDRTHERIARDYEAAGKGLEYRLLKAAVAGTDDIDGKAVAAELKIAPGTVRVLTHRLRKHFRAALKDEIAETVSTRAEVDEELANLFSVFE